MPQPPSPSEKPNPTPEKPHCVHCGDVIGAYEPMILIEDGKPRKTSTSAEQNRDRHASDHYHMACYPQ
jgi:hypothetical protein